MYASDDTRGKEASGSIMNYTVGGTDVTPGDDTDGPEIRSFYLNTSEFKDGDKVNDTPVFTAIMWDASGINVGGSSLGHDIMLTIDDNPSLSWSLNNYYESYLEGEEGESIVRFPVPQLEEGKHTAEFKVWDIYNNSSIVTFSFIVTDNFKPSITALLAAPSPATDYVNFIIGHNVPEVLINVEIQVYDISGKLQWQMNETGTSESDTFSIKWNLTNQAGVKLPSGVYIYRVSISSAKSGKVTKANKLIIRTQ